MSAKPKPHDLLWGMTPDQLPADAPVWAQQALAAGHPVVVRRALCEPGMIAVGIRGASREQREEQPARAAALVHQVRRWEVGHPSSVSVNLEVASGDRGRRRDAAATAGSTL